MQQRPRRTPSAVFPSASVSRSLGISTVSLEPLESRLLLDGALAGQALGEAFARVSAGLTTLEEINLQLPEGFRDSLRLAEWEGRRGVAHRSHWVADFSAGRDVGTIERLQATLDASLSSPLAPVSARVVDRIGDGLYVVDVPQSDALTYGEIVSAFSGVEGFVSMEPDLPIWSAVTPDDPSLHKLWGLNNTGQTGGTPDADIDMPEAWDLATGDGSVVVGVIDTGIDPTHKDLAANVWQNVGEIAGNDIDDDGNGYIDDTYGWDFIDEDNVPQDGHGHGTHVSGTIGGVGDDGSGIVGVNWDVRIMGLKFLSDGGSGMTSNAIEAINYANTMRQMWLDTGGTKGANVRLTSNSWGGGQRSQELVDAVARSDELGMLFVVAAGNAASNNDAVDYWPANLSTELDNVITVAATDHNDRLAGFSSYGAESVHLGAPGVAVYSSLPGDQYAAWSGTSMATPHVAGVAALCWSFDPNASWQDVKSAILAGVDPIDDLAETTITGGRLNAFNTLSILGMAVAGASPGRGGVVTSPPLDFEVTWNYDYNPASVDAGDLLVNGLPAESYTLVDADTISFHYNTSPVTAEGEQTLRIPAGSILRHDDRPSIEWDSAFRYDVHRMQVASTDPAEGSLVPLPMTRITLTLDEDVVASSVSLEDLITSQGMVVDYEVLDARTVRYDLDFVFREEAFTVTLPAGAYKDVYGNPSVEFVGTYALDYAGIILPDSGLFKQLAPAGAQMYEYDADGTVAEAGNVDEFGLELDAGQAITLRGLPEASLELSMELEDPSGTVLASTSGAAGETVTLATTEIATFGQYVLRVTGLNDTTGAYELNMLLNGVFEAEPNPGATNDDLASAESIDGAFHASGDGELAGVVGTADDAFAEYLGPDGYGYSATIVDYLWEDISTSAEKIVYPTEYIRPGDLGEFVFPFYGKLYRDIYITDKGFITFESPFFRNASTSDLLNTPTQAAIAPYWNAWMGNGQGSNKLPDTGLYWEIRDEDADDERLIIQWNGMSMVNHNTPEIYFQAILYADGRIRFNHKVIEYGHEYDGGGTATVGIKDVGQAVDNRLLILYRDEHSPYLANEQSLLISPELTAPTLTGGDCYAFTLQAGQSSAVSARFTGADGRIELYDADGSLLAMGSEDPMPGHQAISPFTASQAGTYYVRVLGGGEGNAYSLAVTRDSDFDFDRPGAFENAQELITGQVVGWAGNTEMGPDNFASLDVLAWEDGYQAFSILPIFDQLSIEAVTPEDMETFGELMTSQTWDLVLINQQNYVESRWVPYVEDHVAAGGAAIVYDWTSHLLEGFDMRYTRYYNLGSFSELAEPDPSDPGRYDEIWNNVSTPLTPNSSVYRLYSWGMEAADGGVALAQFSADFDDDHHAVVVGAEGRTFVNGFLYESINQADSAQLARNEVLYALGSSFERRDDWYAFDVDAGATLEISTDLPAVGDGEFVNTLDPKIELYDPSGALVASDDNGLDGLNATLSYLAPAGGTYRVRVVGISGEGDYVLTIDGRNDVLQAFEVTEVTPADGASLPYTPQEIRLDVNDTVLATTLDGEDITIDGLHAQAVELIDGDTIGFTLPEGLGDGDHTIAIAAGAFTDVQGTPVAGFTSGYSSDATAPYVASTSVDENALVVPGANTIQIVFSEALDETTLDADDFRLTGAASGVVPPDVFAYDSQAFTVSLTYSDLAEDFYTLEVSSGDDAVQDLAGYDLDGNGDTISGDPFFLHFAAGTASEAYPTPLDAKGPAGGQIYDPSVAGALPAGGAKAYTITLDAGQTVSFAATASHGLHLRIDVLDPAGSTLATASADRVDAPVAVLSAPVESGGQYTIVLQALDGSAGAYSASLLLNAAFEGEDFGGASNDTLDGAQELPTLSVGDGRAALRSVRGTVEHVDDVEGPNAFGYHARQVDFGWEDIIDTGEKVVESGGSQDSYLYVDLVDFAFPFYDSLYSQVGIHEYGALKFDTGILKSTAHMNTDLSSLPSAAIIAPLWDQHELDDYGDKPPNLGVYYDIRGQGASRRMIVQWEGLTYASDEDYPITFQLVCYETTGDILVRYKDVDGYEGNPNFAWNGAEATVGIKDANDAPGGADELLIHYGDTNNRTTHPWVGNGEAFLLGTDVIDEADCYRLDLADGEAVTAALSMDDDAPAATITLYDGAGAPLATSTTGWDNLDAAIEAFVAPASGTYYLEVTGDGAYSLVVTQSATFDLETGDAIDDAQPLGPTRAAVGSLTPEADVEDWYAIDARAGETIDLSTALPGGGEGEFVNDLDPVIELYAPDGSLVLSDDNGADGRNAALTHVATQTGTYAVRVTLAEGGDATPQALEAGLVGEYYQVPGHDMQNYLTDYPDYDSMTPDYILVDGPIDFVDGQGQEQGTGFNGTDLINNFAVRWTGLVDIAQGGDVTFHLNSDDGSRLYVDEQLVVQNDGPHGFVERSGTIDLTPGLHDVRLLFFDAINAAGITLSYTPVGGTKQVVPLGALFHGEPAPPVVGGEYVLHAAVTPPPATVVDRYLFYNASSLDGGDGQANALDDQAIAPDKQPLPAGSPAGPEHVSGYALGINGVMIDVDGLWEQTLAPDDVELATNDSDEPDAWTSAAGPDSIAVRPGQGAQGSDRVTLAWQGAAPKATWLRVTLRANDATGLEADDVFYLASLPGDIDGDQAVDVTDLAILAAQWQDAGAADLDRSGTVDVSDLAILAAQWGASLPDLALAESTDEPLHAAETVDQAGEQDLAVEGEDTDDARAVEAVGAGGSTGPIWQDRPDDAMALAALRTGVAGIPLPLRAVAVLPGRPWPAWPGVPSSLWPSPRIASAGACVDLLSAGEGGLVTRPTDRWIESGQPEADDALNLLGAACLLPLP